MFKNLKEKANALLSDDRILLLIYVIVSFPILLNHVPWRDEAQAWLIARDCPDIASMVKILGYEGSPGLWHFMLRILVDIGLPYFYMTIFHYMLILTVVVLFIKFAPFTRFQKLLFVLGYYIVYQYCVLARSYVLAFLFLFIIATLYKERFVKPLKFAITIFFLANSNTHSLIMSIILCGFYFFEVITQDKENLKKYMKEYMVAFIIIGTGIFAAIYQIRPPVDVLNSQWNLNIFSARSFEVLTKAIVGGIFPVRQNTLSDVNGIQWYAVTKYFALLLFGGTFFLFRKKIKPLILYALLNAGLYCLFVMKHPGGLRHHGLLYAIFIFSLWIYNEYEFPVKKGDKAPVGVKNRSKSKSKDKQKNVLVRQDVPKRTNYEKFRYALITGILSFCVLGGAIAWYYEFNYDFSAAKKVANYLYEKGFVRSDVLMVAFPSEMGSAILPYITEPELSKFFYIDYNEFGSYVVWNDKKISEQITEKLFFDRVFAAANSKNYSDILFISSVKLGENTNIVKRFKLIKSFEESIEASENFYIYELRSDFIK